MHGVARECACSTATLDLSRVPSHAIDEITSGDSPHRSAASCSCAVAEDVTTHCVFSGPCSATRMDEALPSSHRTREPVKIFACRMVPRGANHSGCARACGVVFQARLRSHRSETRCPAARAASGDPQPSSLNWPSLAAVPQWLRKLQMGRRGARCASYCPLYRQHSCTCRPFHAKLHVHSGCNLPRARTVSTSTSARHALRSCRDLDGAPSGPSCAIDQLRVWGLYHGPGAELGCRKEQTQGDQTRPGGEARCE